MTKLYKARRWATISALLLTISCTEKSELLTSDTEQPVSKISATSADWIMEPGETRALDLNSDGGLSFSWALGDVLGIYPLGGDQVSFPISDGAGSKTALFDGGTWALRPSYKYAAYYPFSEANYDIAMSQLPVSLIGQTQSGNNSLSLASPFDYQAAAATQPDANGSVMLNFQHLCSFMKLKLTVKDPGTYTHVKVISNNTEFGTKAKYDLSAATPALVATKTSPSVEMDLSNITTTSENELVTIYCLAVPTDLSGSELSVELTNAEGIRYVNAEAIPGKNMVAGHMYGYAANMEDSGINENVAILTDGMSFNRLIKSLTTNEEIAEDPMNTPDEIIETIKFENNPAVKSGVIVSADNSGHKIYANYANKTVTISTDVDCIMTQGLDQAFASLAALTSIQNLSMLNTQNADSFTWMFWGCSSLLELDLSSFDTQNARNFFVMFGGCSSLLELDLSSFDTHNAIYMPAMFQGCYALTSLDLSNFNTENVYRMDFMFESCSSLTELNVSSFNTQNVVNMSLMFSGCSSLTSLDLSNFDTRNVTDMNYMFSGCYSLTSLNINNFNTQNVTEMMAMFEECHSLTTLDVSSFNTKNVLRMNRMFNGCSSLTSLNLSNFNTEKVTEMAHMFWNCSSLTDLDLTNFNTANVENIGMMFAECTSLKTLNLSSSFDLYKVSTNDVIWINDAEWVISMARMFENCTATVSCPVSVSNAIIQFDTAHDNCVMIDGITWNVTDIIATSGGQS